jgi:DNA-binding MarR family transcriptional regulator
LVHRQIGTQDHRQINLLLTDLGRVRMVQIRKDVEEQDRALIEKLDEDEGVLLLRLLSRIG